jgi:hypothetical protein
MSPGLPMVLVPLASIAVFVGAVLIGSTVPYFRAQRRLSRLRAAARARGWYMERSSLYWVAWASPSGPIIVKHTGTGDRWYRLTGSYAPLESEADALEAVLEDYE